MMWDVKRERMASALEDADPTLEEDQKFMEDMAKEMKKHPMWVPTDEQLRKAEEIAWLTTLAPDE